eukprot:m.244506 g.244506  ORF g.244506 m.244506 type:complete len:80 (-) comp53661_c0_seq1:959-1198(-)
MCVFRKQLIHTLFNLIKLFVQTKRADVDYSIQFVVVYEICIWHHRRGHDFCMMVCLRKFCLKSVGGELDSSPVPFLTKR